mmetsp:Transcript_14409/g.35120  ORF Transcript_14409/g.35120 Transcript_14409/m.35120 type:complete len:315 (-) Transcript_14409:523-1467(-)|eukprot:CAMPEP_0114517492 /NCGR_PEP_ID=MMETSP0109-20121206/17922_1 /TAXON_ID=29199 /ORGANISM="Chlorarachnion reptans, Strain CCCM449" /LENGTH=314 /DNA_ID=CAMNT_0001698015 /DNA_START=79 /DNA_END=1023 /DNA_ORIENTATION=+
MGGDKGKEKKEQKEKLTEEKLDLFECLSSVQKKGKEEHWWIDAKEVHLKKDPPAIGEVSRVYRAKWRRSDIVVKTMANNKQHHTEDVNALIEEIAVWSTIRHPSIVMFLGASFNLDLGVMLLLEEMAGGTLEKYMRERQAVNMRRCWKIGKDIAGAIAFLHSCRPPIIHGDINPQNVLINKFGEPKIADFGLSKFVRHKKRKEAHVFELRYIAPEALLNNEATLKSDVFSFGVLIFDLFSPPTKNKGEKYVVEDYKGMAKNRKTLNYSSIKNAVVRDILDKCIQIKEEDRADVASLHSIFEEQAAKRESECVIL